MRLVVLYRQNSEQARSTEEFMHEFTRRTTKNIEVIDPDTRDGTNLAAIHDIVMYPAILALTDDGRPLNTWQGDMLPLMDEVAAYANL